MKKISFLLKKWRRQILIIAVVFAVVCILLRPFLPLSDSRMRRCAVMVERHSWYEISIGGKAMASFREIGVDTSFTDISLRSDSVHDIRYYNGCWVNKWTWWPSCQGRIITVTDHLSDRGNIGTKVLMERGTAALNKQIALLEAQIREIGYYKRVHVVSDEGYGMIANYAAKKTARLEQLKRIADVLGKEGTAKSVSISRKYSFSAHYRDENGKARSVECTALPKTESGCMPVLQTADRRKPTGVTAVSVTPFDGFGCSDVAAVAFAGIIEPSFANVSAKPIVVKGKTKTDGRHDFPNILVAKGAPVFSAFGMFKGVVYGNSVAGCKSIYDELHK